MSFKKDQLVYVRGKVVGGNLNNRPRILPITANGQEHPEGSLAMTTAFLVVKKKPTKSNKFECGCGLPAVYGNLDRDPQAAEFYCPDCLLKKLHDRVIATSADPEPIGSIRPDNNPRGAA